MGDSGGYLKKALKADKNLLMEDKKYFTCGISESGIPTLSQLYCEFECAMFFEETKKLPRYATALSKLKSYLFSLESFSSEESSESLSDSISFEFSSFSSASMSFFTFSFMTSSKGRIS